MSWQTDRVKEPRKAKPYCKPSPTGSIRRLEIHSRTTSTSQFAIQHQQHIPTAPCPLQTNLLKPRPLQCRPRSPPHKPVSILPAISSKSANSDHLHSTNHSNEHGLGSETAWYRCGCCEGIFPPVSARAMPIPTLPPTIAPLRSSCAHAPDTI